MKPKLVTAQQRLYVDAMGDAVGREYIYLYEDLLWLHCKWNQYRDLFGEFQGVEHLNRVAPYLFAVVQNVLWHDIVLHLARLTDPPHTAGKRNVTLSSLGQALPAEVRGDFTDLLKGVDTAVEFARDIRNRAIAHADYHVAIGHPPKPLAAADVEAVQKALKALRSAMNVVERHYTGSTNVYTARRLRGAKSLLRHLGAP